MEQERKSEVLTPEIVDDAHVDHGRPRPHADASATAGGYGLTVTDPGAIGALVAAVLSWIIIPIIGAIVALVIAPGAKRRIRQSNGQIGGQGLATAAQIIAALNIVAGIFLIWVIVSIIRWIF